METWFWFLLVVALGYIGGQLYEIAGHLRKLVDIQEQRRIDRIADEI